MLPVFNAYAEHMRAHANCRLKRNAQHESCELSFIWGKMRTTARETETQIALRNCSKEVGGRSVLSVILVKGVCSVKHTCGQRLGAGHEKQVPPLMILVLF